MDDDEWEILELAGAHLFAFALVPLSWYESQIKPVELVRDENQQVIETWWKHDEPAISVVDYCDNCLIRSDSSPYDHGLMETVWSDTNHHRVELWETEVNVVAHLDIKIDVRYPYSDFLAKVITLAVSANCLFYFCYENSFVQPSSVAVFEALNRSPAARLTRKEIARSKNH